MRMLVPEQCFPTPTWPLLQPYPIFHKPLVGSAVIQLLVFEIYTLAPFLQRFYRSIFFPICEHMCLTRVQECFTAVPLHPKHNSYLLRRELQACWSALISSLDLFFSKCLQSVKCFTGNYEDNVLAPESLYFKPWCKHTIYRGITVSRLCLLLMCLFW